jgi:uncharacterized membrane protein YraQ (UPF0718 family)/YHS domain-containing protein
MNSLARGLQDGWWMFFDTFWALILGFSLSGLIQAFVSRPTMKSLLGDHSAPAIARASFFGVISSSCSYAASGLANSLQKKGADFTAAMVFMFASTNLVIELGLVLWVLIGWQFAAAEFIGGALMILLLWAVLPWATRGLTISNRGLTLADEDSMPPQPSLRDAAGFAIGDFRMMRTELVAGFIVAGLATRLIPTHIWTSLFLSGHGAVAQVENAFIGPVIACISFVCSVGNIPLAAALWHAGITFGGTISFIYADLLSLPLILLYRKYFGVRLTRRLVVVFWFVMSISGLVTGGIFAGFKWIPARHAVAMSTRHVGMNATTILDVLSLVLVAIIILLYLSKPGENSDFAVDPVCGMQVRKSAAAAIAEVDGVTYYFCMEGCKENFLARGANLD